MQLIKSDGTKVSSGEAFTRTPIPPEMLEAHRRAMEEAAPEIEEEIRKREMQALVLGPAPVGGEDEYFAAMRKRSEK